MRTSTLRSPFRAAAVIAPVAAALVLLSFGGTAQQNPQQSFAFEPARDDFALTALDASRFVPAPAGRHGFVQVKGDRFVFQDGTPARFWGAQMNLFRDREDIDYAVKRMRRQGINITRLHGLEFLIDRNGKTFFDYSKDGFDRLDYLIAKLGENGIYLILDPQYPLFTRVKPGDGIEELPQGGVVPFAEFFHPKIAKMTQRRMVDVFTHLNPYTKKRYCDDATLAMVEILNEDSLYWAGAATPELKPVLQARFAEWLRRKYGSNDGLRKAWGASLADGEGLDAGQAPALIRNADFNEKYFNANPDKRRRGQDQFRFFYELEHEYWQQCRRALREAGLKVPISGTNWQGHGFTTKAHMLAQSKLDYIDRHGYWDHPQGEGNLKWNIKTALFHNLPMVKAVSPDQNALIYLGVGNLVIEKAWEQVLGLPMTLSEWNTCLPNEYSLEGTGLMAAYGLMQGWDGPLEFGYFSPDFRNQLGSGSFDMFGNPPQILQFPAVTTMWHRGDLREAEVVAESLYGEESVFSLTDDRKPVPIAAALVGKVGYRFTGKPRKPAVKDISKYWDPERLVARSITGELTWDAKQGVVTVDSPRTQAFIGFLSAKPPAARASSLRSAAKFGAVWVTANDGMEPIAKAKRIVVTAVGPARNTGMQYAQSDEMSRLKVPFMRLAEVGTAPILQEVPAGELEIRTAHAARMKAWALDVVGRRVREVPVRASKGTLTLSISAEHKTVYYEIGVE